MRPPTARCSLTLPKIIAALKANPSSWYQANKLNAAQVADRGAKAHQRAEHFDAEHGTMHAEQMVDMDAMAGTTPQTVIFWWSLSVYGF
jgi:hypothetical protein